MKWPWMGLVVFAAALGTTDAGGQGRSEPAGRSAAAEDWRVATPGRPGTDAGARPAAGQGLTAMARAAAANKYLFVFFWKEKSPQADAVWNVLQPAMGRLAEWADWTAVRITDPAEKPLVERFGVDRAPMPLVLALAPNGAITKAFPGKLEESQLRAAFVSPGTELCLKALQDRKLVLLCVGEPPPPQNRLVVPAGVGQFKADPRYARMTEVVLLDPREPAEKDFLQELRIDPRIGPVTVLMAPPGGVVGKFPGSVSKDQLVAKLATSRSACPDGKCGPNGCGPKR